MKMILTPKYQNKIENTIKMSMTEKYQSNFKILYVWNLLLLLTGAGSILLGANFMAKRLMHTKFSNM